MENRDLLRAINNALIAITRYDVTKTEVPYEEANGVKGSICAYVVKDIIRIDIKGQITL